ncbi:MAG: flagellar hook protein FlgE [Alphaproteobacteria bacterium]|nr:flagellar hook protein FlgE [Alphaproteobacteria bacterium]
MTLSVELSGLQAAQTDLDTIGNNIANVNTVGFKSSTPLFADVYSTSLLGSAGVKNDPGQGATTNSLSQLFTEGSISQTGNALDVAINGNGFFQVQTGSGAVAYTRDGSMQINANGLLTNDSGALIMGYAAPASGASSTAAGVVGPIKIDQSNIPAAATTNLSLNLSLPTTETPIDTTATPFSVSNSSSYNHSSATTVYDSLGSPVTLTTFYTEVSGSGSPPHWQTHWEASSSSGKLIASGAGATLTFNSSGKLTAGSGTISVGSLPDGAAPLSIAQSFGGTTLSDLPFGVNTVHTDGSAGGQFAGIQIGSNGNVVAQYSNGLTKVLGTVTLANFQNPQGLTPISGNNWIPSATSGQAVTNPPGTGGLGSLEPGALEGSNVDLSAQLVNLIVAQQAYQANVQGINVDQQDVQKLLNLQ